MTKEIEAVKGTGAVADNGDVFYVEVREQMGNGF